jgi:hypothetical protein
VYQVAEEPKAPEAPEGLMVVIGRLDLIGTIYFASQLGGGVDQSGETLRTDISRLPQVLQGYQGDLFFGLSAIQTGFHKYFTPQSYSINMPSGSLTVQSVIENRQLKIYRVPLYIPPSTVSMTPVM